MRRSGAKRHWKAVLGLAGALLAFGGCGGATGDGTARSGTPDGPDGAIGTGGSTGGTGGQGPGGGSSTGGESHCLGIACAGCAVGYKSVTVPGACCPTCVPDCNGVKCTSPSCAPGSTPYTPADQCCPICGPDCTTVDCAIPPCPTGEKVLPSPGQCCGSCKPVEGGAPVCNPGIDGLIASEITTLDALMCKTSSDCEIVSLGAQCKLDCGTAVNVASSGALMKAVMGFSAANCTGCPQTNMACPPVYYTAECQNGQCTRVP